MEIIVTTTTYQVAGNSSGWKTHGQGNVKRSESFGKRQITAADKVYLSDRRTGVNPKLGSGGNDREEKEAVAREAEAHWA